ncbi:MAG: hypothetical protein PHC38_04070 [Weeksellaceae bacterium]|jgi:hydroxylamine reductase (hybrid-cluster protein)|nr:hypothetical protein [Weeksellaceae bacterium]
MKKVVFLFWVSFFVLQCTSSKELTQEENRKQLEQKYKMPNFSNSEVQDYAYEFLLLIEEIKNSEEKSEQAVSYKIEEFQEKTQTIADKMTMEDTRKFVDWSMRIMSEIRLNPENTQ